jgi:hypothetical protein
LVADLATKLPARSVIIVDGDIPPPQGAASPVRPTLREFIRSLADVTGTLPIWSKWYSGDAHRTSLVGLDILASDPVAFARFENGLPKMRVDWFDDTIELARWDHIPAGYIQTSEIFDHATLESAATWLASCETARHASPSYSPSCRDCGRHCFNVASARGGSIAGIWAIDARKLPAKTFGTVKGLKLGQVAAVTSTSLTIHCQDGFVEVARCRVGEGKKGRRRRGRHAPSTILGD